RRNTIQEGQKAYGDIGWKTGYINTGFFMVSKPHACIFEKINGNLWGGTGVDDIQLGYNIVKNKIPVYDFHWKWNTMTMFCEKWNGSPDRFNSYITHFAGVGKFENRFNNRLENIKHDYNKIWGKNE
ncbi:MAG: hypothetical protein KKF27_21520, partial [Gammaproteobacteria bacterium]|nr:hypothetical protein [Gammaproteobacteria bacterium]